MENIDTRLPARGEKGDSADIQNVEIDFTESADKENLQTGDTLPLLFGKLGKWFMSFGALAWKSTVDYKTEMENLPYIPEKTSDLKNDSGYIGSTQASTLINAHNASGGSHEDIRLSVATVEAIARGKSRAKVFDTEEQMDLWLTEPENRASLREGDNFYIRDTDVPDYWWDGERKQVLGTEKVDLSDFYTKEQSGYKFSGKPSRKAVSILPDDWTGEGSLYSVFIGDEDVTGDCFLEAWPADRDSKGAASEAGVDENIVTEDGGFVLTAGDRPAGAVSIIYTVIK